MPSAYDELRSAAFRVRINGVSLAEQAVNDLEALSVQEDVDAMGMFTLRLCDWDTDRLQVGWMDEALFTVGNEVEIQMGYKGDVALTTLMVGQITGLEPTFSNETIPILTVRGYDLRHRLLHETRSRAYEYMRDSDIASQIAFEAGLHPQVENTRVVLARVTQHNQTDLAFLRQRAQRIGYEVMVVDRTLVFRLPPVDGSAAVTLTMNRDITDLSLRLTTMEQIAQREVRGWDMKTKSVISSQASTVSGMGGTNTGPSAARKAWGSARGTSVQVPVLSKGEADRMAQGQLQAMALTYISGEGTCRGRTDLRAGTVIRIDGAGQRFSGQYYVTATTHSISAEDGYQTSFSVRRNAT